MEIFGVRLVGINSDTLTKLLLTAVIVVVALVARAAVGATAGRTMHRATRRTVWIRKGIKPADLEPQASLRSTDNWVELSVRFLVRAWGVRATKDAITRAILARYRAEGISIASATFELVKAPELSIRPVDGRAARPDASERGAPWDER